MLGLFDRIEDARALAQVIVETVREPLLVLDGRFRILFASRSFHDHFAVAPEDTLERSVFALGAGAWDIPELRTQLGAVLADGGAIENVEVGKAFPGIGLRTLRLHARLVAAVPGAATMILLNIEDITERRAIEVEKEALKHQADELIRHKETLLEEMQHRIVNSLQIIASILMLKARAVTSEETRQHLTDAHRRVISVAAVQRHLHGTGRIDRIEVGPYLSELCKSLAASMIGEGGPAVLIVAADDGTAPSADAVSLGLIVTELVINALKYAFPASAKSAEVRVRYEVHGTDWKLTVADNGVGKPEGDGMAAKGGLGTSLVNALAQQLDAKVLTASGPGGMTVTVTHATFTARQAA
ncbi:MAG: histidine kinase dimerization/phosphoacceptor domain -containing protein [Rhizomicrobium sp.]